MVSLEKNSANLGKRAEDISAELLAMAEADQSARKHWQETGEVYGQTLDKKNAEYLKEIIGATGWPMQSKVGSDAANAAWLLVQHADHDPEFQQQCLELMKQLPEGEVEKKDVAFLEDRVRANAGRPTLYGTQFGPNEDGVFGSLPIETREKLNERRAAVGLGLFEDYEQEMLALNREIEGVILKKDSSSS